MKNSAEQDLCVYHSIAKAIVFMLAFSIVIYSQDDWKQLAPPNAPSARQGHSMIALPDGKVSLFGGEGPQEDLFNDLYIFQENDWEEVDPDGDKPLPRTDAAAWVRENIFYIHGGKGANADVYNDMWIYDFFVNRWQEVEINSTKPSGRFSHSSAVLSDGKVLITGGQTGEESYSFETWLYDPVTNTFEQKSNIPFPTSEQSLVVSESQVIPLQVFGENQEMIYYDELTDNWNYFLPKPEDNHPGLSASAAYCDADENGAYLIGGEEYIDGTGYETTNKVWKFDLIEKTWSAAAELVDKLLHAEVVYDKLNDRLLLFGGKDETGNYVNSMYEYRFNPTSVSDNSELTKGFKLEQNYPNPFNPTTSIKFRLSSFEIVTLTVYNFLGEQVAILVNEQKSPGVYEVKFSVRSLRNATNLSSGVYYYRITAGNFSQTRKMMMLK